MGPRGREFGGSYKGDPEFNYIYILEGWRSKVYLSLRAPKGHLSYSLYSTFTLHTCFTFSHKNKQTKVLGPYGKDLFSHIANK